MAGNVGHLVILLLVVAGFNIEAKSRASKSATTQATSPESTTSTCISKLLQRILHPLNRYACTVSVDIFLLGRGGLNSHNRERERGEMAVGEG